MMLLTGNFKNVQKYLAKQMVEIRNEFIYVYPVTNKLEEQLQPGQLKFSYPKGFITAKHSNTYYRLVLIYNAFYGLKI